MTQNVMNFFEKNSAIIKMAVIALLSLLLMIPVVLIDSLVMERKQRQTEALEEVSSKWGLEQQLVGPILTVPFTTYDLNKENERINVTRRMAYFLPDQLNIRGTLTPEVRYRGIFKVPVYQSDVVIQGYFEAPRFDSGHPNTEIDWDEAFLSIGITDMRGISKPVSFNWNGNELAYEPGVSINNLITSGITLTKPFSREVPSEKYQFDINLSVNGSRRMSFVPIGKETTVTISSAWNDPSFDGAFLPASRDISDEGFTATWKILELNRNYPQKWIDKNFEMAGSAFGVALLLPNDNYQLTERSMKYAILFIALTFITFFFIEILQKKKVHPVQYILVGFGLVLFYLLLLSLSEHIGFNFSYLIASAAIIILISGYSSTILKNNRLVYLMASFLAILYGFLFVLLHMQDFTLLIGSIALFLILSTLMFISRKIDWYNLSVKD